MLTQSIKFQKIVKDELETLPTRYFLHKLLLTIIFDLIRDQSQVIQEQETHPS
jgi:hypothetical protein